jgi:toxin YoeB
MKLEFDPQALADLKYWAKRDKSKTGRIFRLIEEIQRSPFSGLGKPEPLKYTLRGCWSRRIDREHRLVYKMEGKTLFILACRYHY